MMPTEQGIMVTTTQKEANNKKSASGQYTLIAAAIISVIGNINGASANELRVTGTLATDVVQQTIDDDSANNSQIEDVTTFQVIPTINAEYRTKTFQGRWSGKYSYLDREFDDIERSDNFGEYLYSASWSPFDSLLTLSANGALNYQNISTNGAFINDFLLNSGELAKTRSNRYEATVRLPNTPWFRAQGSLSYSDTASEESEFEQTLNLDNDSWFSEGQIINGADAEYFFWQINGAFQTTDRSQGNQGDFVSRSGQGNFNWVFLKNLALNVTVRHEANQISDTSDVFSEGREFNSYGAGLSYRQSENRFITLTVNSSDSEFEESDAQTFVGVAVNWAFSPRTSFSGEYGKRFYGDSGRATFTHNRKRFRSQIAYNEEVTSFSRLIANPENLGVFVCADGNVDLSACFQPSTLNYDLQSGEQFVQFSTVNTDINDEVVIRKSLNAQLGYQGKRVNFSLSGQYGFNESVEINRQQRLYNVGIQASYTLGRYTTIDGKLSYGETAQRSETLQNGENQSLVGSLQISRELGQSLSANLQFQYTDRDGDLNIGGGQLLSDRRVSIGLTYRYE